MHIKSMYTADTSSCRKGETYSSCRGHCQKSCSDLDREPPCPSGVCIGACVCDAGLIRHKSGWCLFEDACNVNVSVIQNLGCPDERNCDAICRTIHQKGVCIEHLGPEKTLCVCTK
ncbi:hypothetical protein CDAR_213451 [Caerostris darwini]|uniref:TIL domain-containing protein n=1 Tax=Caerostris darwini TaxID=1538125 RepID=A0AAV4QUA6_9ARAC|nr:hypothetical protein CDAR_213451 [Caerostris darwini]